MRPGSRERIEFYRQQAEQRKPVFDLPILDEGDRIPLHPTKRPREFQKIQRKDAPMPSIKDALATILADPAKALAELDTEIAAHETQLAELKQMRKMLAKPQKKKSGQSKSQKTALLEQQICDLLESGPQRISDISKLLNVDGGFVGRTVKASARLVRDSEGNVHLTAPEEQAA